MTTERTDGSVPLTSIYINLKQRCITFATEDQATKLTLAPEGVFYQLLQGAAITTRSVDRLVGEAEAEAGEVAGPEKEPTITLSGKLKSKPRQGRADGSGNPTAWARLAAHM